MNVIKYWILENHITFWKNQRGFMARVPDTIRIVDPLTITIK